MDYVITNKRKQIYIRLDDNGTPKTCTKQLAQRFESSKARNILVNLPKTLKKFHFTVEPIPDILPTDNSKKSKKSIKNDSYNPSENITQWIDKFGSCADILEEAKNRESQLISELKNVDNELLDLLHIIEMEKSKDLYRGWMQYKRIKANREKRRMIKDEIIIVENVLEKIDPTCLQREKVKKAIDGLFCRKYKFRIVEEDVKSDL